MARFIGKSYYFRFNGRAVAGADAFNGAVVQRGAVQIGKDDLMGFLVGVGEVTDGPVFRDCPRLEGKGQRVLVPGLKFHFGKVHAATVDPGRRSGFETAQ